MTARRIHLSRGGGHNFVSVYYGQDGTEVIGTYMEVRDAQPA